MIALIQASQQMGGGQIGEIARTFGVDWTHLAAQTISFGLVCAILYKFAYPRVLAMLEERRQQIASGLANAEKIKAELDRTEAQRLEIIAHAHDQAAKFIQEARDSAALLRALEIKKAHAAAEQILMKAHEAAGQDRERMLAELKGEVGRLVVQATATLTGKMLTSEDHRRLAEATARQIAA
jgi:F-type H+-transporting ATPase subunit b